MTSPTLSDASSSPDPVPVPTAAQQKVLDRIALQRERLRARRAARAQAMALAQRDAGPMGADESLALRAAGFARQHPLAVAAMAGVALVAGPRRLVRWAGVVLPLLMRLRR
ncbi:MAG: hypothetical protein LWW96_13030 [Acidovorax sp.]|uniref:hypothetical protein n=1 Tax=Acidovorax sp. TaxID=1872122 RepID=UPI0025BA0C0A|nr:hypothetical protein [Acidovorax sp.]MCE1193066.1 hypothetical protein [Acidovorax sp.]